MMHVRTTLLAPSEDPVVSALDAAAVCVIFFFFPIFFSTFLAVAYDVRIRPPPPHRSNSLKWNPHPNPPPRILGPRAFFCGGAQVEGGRLVRVTFDATCSDTMPWQFRPTQADVKVGGVHYFEKLVYIQKKKFSRFLLLFSVRAREHSAVFRYFTVCTGALCRRFGIYLRIKIPLFFVLFLQTTPVLTI